MSSVSSRSAITRVYRGGHGPSIGFTLVTRNSGSVMEPGVEADLVVELIAPLTPVCGMTPLEDAPAVAAAFGDGTSPPTIWTRFPTYGFRSLPDRRYPVWAPAAPVPSTGGVPVVGDPVALIPVAPAPTGGTPVVPLTVSVEPVEPLVSRVPPDAVAVELPLVIIIGLDSVNGSVAVEPAVRQPLMVIL